jgi:hypothetical protein
LPSPPVVSVNVANESGRAHDVTVYTGRKLPGIRR